MTGVIRQDETYRCGRGIFWIKEGVVPNVECGGIYRSQLQAEIEAYITEELSEKKKDGTYECFPIGGTHMGEQKTGLKKVDRIVQLERLKVELEIK